MVLMTKPFIVDPRAYDKDKAFSSCLSYANQFLALNRFSKPLKIITISLAKKLKQPTTLLTREGKTIGWYDYGWYKFGTREMYVNIKHTKNPVLNPGFAWSFTGHKSDLTAPGVLAHEMGHHVHNLLGMIHGIRDINESIKRVCQAENAVSTYEPNVYEAFAEAMRLFILNPELLREGRAVRWALIHKALGVKPLHNTPWRDVLVNAHPKIIAAAQSWINKRYK